MATTSLTRTPVSNGNARTFTISSWIKRGNLSSTQPIFSSGVSGSDAFDLFFQSADTLSIEMYESGTGAYNVKTEALFRDVGAWYHVVVAVDTEQGTEADRYKFYVNGIQHTLTEVSDGYPPEDYDIPINQTTTAANIGVGKQYSSNYFDGEMAHTHFIDGTAYAPTAFGETDSTSGIWVAKTSPSVTYGTNGFFLKYQDTSNFGDDSSGNTNDLTLSGTMTQTKDNPDNNFCTANPLANFNSGGTYSNGNTKWVTPTDVSTRYNISTMGLVAGKWYCEVKMKQSNTSMIGITDKEQPDSSEAMAQTNYGAAYKSNDGKYIVDGGSATTYGDSYTTDDIVGIYLDLDNNKLYFGKNGTVQNSGTGITITGISAMTSLGVGSQSCYFIGGTKDNGGSTFEFNFGNGYFGTTIVTSGVADAGGEGTFEYDPSSGTFDGSSKDFRAMCTNNIATYGG